MEESAGIKDYFQEETAALIWQIQEIAKWEYLHKPTDMKRQKSEHRKTARSRVV